MSSLLCLWRCLHPAILAMVAFCSLNPVEPFAFGEDKLSHSVQPEHWQRRGNCGVNVAYLMLKAYGRRVSYNELNNQLDPKPAIGNSALEIREETRRRGLNLDVVQLEPDDLTSIPLPAILYLEAEKGLGHYVILLDTDGVNARIIDGTKCFEEEVPLNSATRHWTGVALITSTRYDLRYVAALFLLIVSVSSGVLLLLRIKTPVTRVITFAAVLGLLMSLLFIVRAKVRTEPISTVADAISDKTYVQGESVRPFPIAPKGTPLNLLDRNSLAQMADMAKPYWPYRRMSLMLHCLRVFGPTMEFDGPAPFPVSKRTVGLSCPDILELILNADLYQSESNAKMPHFVQTRYYVRQEIGREPALAAHRDDILAMAAEIGLPLSTPIVANGRRFTLRDLLKNSLQSFDLDVELEFTAVAYCGYLWGGGTMA